MLFSYFVQFNRITKKIKGKISKTIKQNLKASIRSLYTQYYFLFLVNPTKLKNLHHYINDAIKLIVFIIICYKCRGLAKLSIKLLISEIRCMYVFVFSQQIFQIIFFFKFILTTDDSNCIFINNFPV